MLDRFFHLSTQILNRLSEHCRMQVFFQVRKQTQEQIDPSRQRVESTPHRNPELQVQE